MRWSGISEQFRTIRSKWGCPDDAQLAGFVDQGLDSAGEASIVQHLARCAECRSQIAFLERMQRMDGESHLPATWLSRVEAITARDAKASTIRKWVPATGIALAAVIITAILLRSTSVPPRTIQTTAPIAQPQVIASAAAPPQALGAERKHDRDVVRKAGPDNSLQIASPTADSHIAPGGAIRWRSVENSMYYEVRLLSADGEVLWIAKVEASQTALPVDIRVPAERKCFLIIRAFLADGKTVESEAIRLFLQPRS